MRIVFAGTAEFAVPSLEALVAARHEVVLVITQPDRPGHRRRLQASPVKLAAERLRLPIAQPERMRSAEAVDLIRRSAPNLLVVVAYGQIIPREILELPSRGALNVHASLLPRHRGAAPIQHALLAGDRVTGVTIMRMDDQLDHGPILAQREAEVGPDEDAMSLTRRLARLGADLLVGTIARLDEIQPREQDHSAATQAGKLDSAQGDLSWEMSAAEIDRRVRALNPSPGARLRLQNTEFKVLRGSPASGSGKPGQVLAADRGGVTVATSEGAYRLEQVQLPGRKPMHARQLVSRAG